MDAADESGSDPTICRTTIARMSTEPESVATDRSEDILSTRTKRVSDQTGTVLSTTPGDETLNDGDRRRLTMFRDAAKNFIPCCRLTGVRRPCRCPTAAGSDGMRWMGHISAGCPASTIGYGIDNWNCRPGILLTPTASDLAFRALAFVRK
jgi:hypothetical protein